MIPLQPVTIVATGGTPMQLCDQRGAPYPTTGFGALVFNTGAHLIDPIIDNPTIKFTVINVPGGDFYNPSIQFTLGDAKTPGFYSTGPGNISLVGTDGSESSRAHLAQFNHPGDLLIPRHIYAAGVIPPLEDSSMVATTQWVNDSIETAVEAGTTVEPNGVVFGQPVTGRMVSDVEKLTFYPSLSVLELTGVDLAYLQTMSVTGDQDSWMSYIGHWADGDGVVSDWGARSFSNSANGTWLNVQKARGSSVATPAAVQAGDKIFAITGEGHDGSQFVSGPRLSWDVAGAVTAGVVPVNVNMNMTTAALGGWNAWEARHDGTTLLGRGGPLSIDATNGVRAPTPPAAQNDTIIPTTAWVKSNTSTALGDYLPLAGGTLTGPLYGTTATFSGRVTGNGLATPNIVDAAGVASSLTLYDGGTGNRNGIGTSSGSLDYRSVYAHNWYSGDALLMALDGTGALGLVGHLTGTSASLSTAIPAAENSTRVPTTAWVTAKGYEIVANKGVANGYAPLDATTKVPAVYLPAYVDDVLEFASLAAFPPTGSSGIIYVALDTNKTYRWSGSVYVEISPSPGSTDAVPEGASNLYYTNERVDDRVAVLIVPGTNITKVYDDVANTLTISATNPTTLPPSGAAGGDLTGAYPNPTLAVDRVRKTGDTMSGELLVGTVMNGVEIDPVGKVQINSSALDDNAGLWWNNPLSPIPNSHLWRMAVTGGDLWLTAIYDDLLGSFSNTIFLRNGGMNLFGPLYVASPYPQSGGSTATPAIRANVTWNDAGIDFTALALDVTNTASGASSKFANFKVGTTSMFSVDLVGNVTGAATVRGTSLRAVGSDAIVPFLVSGTSRAIRIVTSATEARLEGVDITGVGSYQPLVLGGTTVSAPTPATDANDTRIATTAWVKTTLSGGGASIAVGPTPPTTPTSNALWWNSEAANGGGQMFLYYDDGNTQQWVPATPPGAGQAAPTGMVADFAGTAAPPGWVFCQGQALSRTVFAALFAAIGVTYGAGDGTTTFNVPDLGGRVVAGKEAVATRLPFGATLGGTGGAATVTLDANMMPSHGHGVSDPTHVHGIADPGHSHGIGDPGHVHWYASANAGCGCTGGGSVHLEGGAYTGSVGTGIWTGGSGTGVYNDARYTGISVAAAGGGLAHENTQPTMVLNKIIKT